jgi:SAM-dependent methyltransferase
MDAIAAFMPITHNPKPSPGASQRLTAIARAAVPLDGSTRLLDVGCGNGILLPYLVSCSASPEDYRGIDLSCRMVELARKASGASGARFDDVSFDAVVAEGGQRFESVVFHNSLQYFANQASALTAAAGLLSEGDASRIVISHLAGAAAVRQELLDNPTTVVSEMPSLPELPGLASSLGLQVVLPSFFGSEPDQIQAGLDGFYLVILRRASAAENTDAAQAAKDRPMDALLDSIEASLPPL